MLQVDVTEQPIKTIYEVYTQNIYSCVRETFAKARKKKKKKDEAHFGKEVLLGLT